jgi:hypothetical protein
MSDTPVNPPIADVAQPLSRTTSIATQVAPEELGAVSRMSSVAEGELDTDSEQEEQEQEQEQEEEQEQEQEEEQEQEQEEEQEQEQEQQVDYTGDIAGPMLMLGGILFAGLAFFLSGPPTMGHPMTRGDYF